MGVQNYPERIIALPSGNASGKVGVVSNNCTDPHQYSVCAVTQLVDKSPRVLIGNPAGITQVGGNLAI